MADIVDATQDRIEKEEQEVLRRARMDAGISAYMCHDCNAVIPEKRRLALPGVKFCRDCAGRREEEEK
ncbi:MAG: TraR/DksA C4-type zinc finger protein [Thermoplasmataceae archaeon]